MLLYSHLSFCSIIYGLKFIQMFLYIIVLNYVFQIPSNYILYNYLTSTTLRALQIVFFHRLLLSDNVLCYILYFP